VQKPQKTLALGPRRIVRKTSSANVDLDAGTAGSVGRAVRYGVLRLRKRSLRRKMESPKIVTKKLEDIGTRYTHLCDLQDSLESCVEIIVTKLPDTWDNKQRLAKMRIALEIIKISIDSFGDYNDKDKKYNLYKMIENIPKNPDEIVGGRGTPLI
jgi:hypothetical protein